jgi:hypothetical protein
MRSISAFVLALGISLPAMAAGSSVHTFVSFSGVDTNPCSRPAPCRSFAAAILQTASKGIVIAVDSAGYGPVTIGQSISIVAPDGVYAGIAATSGSGVSISGTSATDVVFLRGLSIEGGGTGSFGVLLFLDDLLELHVERCSISDFTSEGILYQPSTAGASLFVADTTLAHTVAGLFAQANPGINPRVSIDRCRAIGNANIGIIMSQAIGVITNSVIAGNGTGIEGQSATGLFTVDHCQISGNTIGLFANQGATVYVSNSTVSNNGTGVSTSGGGIMLNRIGDVTYPVKTNTFTNNGTDGTFTGTFVAK